MKKVLLILVALFTVVSAMAFPKAIYVKKGDEVKKFNFGVAEDLVFSNDGRTLTITGYDEDIKLDEIDYISFSAPVDALPSPPTPRKTSSYRLARSSTRCQPQRPRRTGAHVQQFLHRRI